VEWLEVRVIAKERISASPGRSPCAANPLPESAFREREGRSRHAPYVMRVGISASPVGHFPLEPLSFGLIFLDFRDVVR